MSPISTLAVILTAMRTDSVVRRLIEHFHDSCAPDSPPQAGRLYECTRCQYRERVPLFDIAPEEDSGDTPKPRPQLPELLCPICGGPFLPVRE